MNPVLAAPPAPQGEIKNPNIRINSNRAPDPSDPQYILETAAMEIRSLWHRFERWIGMGNKSTRQKIHPLQKLNMKLPLSINPPPRQQAYNSHQTRHTRPIPKDGKDIQGLRNVLKNHHLEVQDSAGRANQSRENGVETCLSKSECGSVK